MPISLFCPSCNGLLQVPEMYAGRRGRCRHCHEPVSVPQASDPAAEAAVQEALAPPSATEVAKNPAGATLEAETVAADDERERRPCPACGEMILTTAVKCRYCREVLDASMKGALAGSSLAYDPAWAKVRAGAKKLYYACGLYAGAFLIAGIAGVVMGSSRSGPRAVRDASDLPEAFFLVVGIVALVCLAAKIVTLIGLSQCAQTPPDCGAKSLAVGALVCSLIAAACTVAAIALNAPEFNGLNLLFSLFTTGMIVCFISRVGQVFGDDRLPRSTVRFVVYMIVCFVIGIVGVIGIAQEQSGPASVIPLLLAVIGSFAGVLWYLRLLRGLASLLERSTLT